MSLIERQIAAAGRYPSWSVFIRVLVWLVLMPTLWPSQASAMEPTYRVGAGGWIFEQFGADVAVLRAPVSAGRTADDEAGLLLTCSGVDRRIRLSFPRPVASTARGPRHGRAVIAPFGTAPALGFVAAFELTNGSVLLFSDKATPGRDPVATLARLLLTRPKELDILVSVGPEPTTLNRLMVYRLLLTIGPENAATVRYFLASCGRAPVRSPD